MSDERSIEDQARESNVARWRKVGEVMDAARRMASRASPPPSPWRWIMPAVSAVMFLACAVSVAVRKPDGFTQCAAAALFVGDAFNRMSAALKAWRDGR